MPTSYTLKYRGRRPRVKTLNKPSIETQGRMRRVEILIKPYMWRERLAINTDSKVLRGHRPRDNQYAL